MVVNFLGNIGFNRFLVVSFFIKGWGGVKRLACFSVLKHVPLIKI